MRVGVLDTWLPRRYLPFWEAYLSELGARVVRPEGPFQEALKAPAPDWAPPSLRAVLGRIDELASRVDRVLLPDAQLGIDAERGGGQCPWVRDLAATVRELRPTAPRFWVVPAEPTEAALGLAATIGAEIAETPRRVTLALERTRHLLAPPGPFALPGAAPEPAVGLAAPPYLLEEPRLYRPLLEVLAAFGVGVADRPPALLREEGRRMGTRALLPTDLEWAGAAHYLARRRGVRAVVLLLEDCPGLWRVARWIQGALPARSLLVPVGTPPEDLRRALEAG